jgi:hypothetical protein
MSESSAEDSNQANYACVAIAPHLAPNNTPSNALINIINVINAHNNDIFLTMLNIISAKYNISQDDMLEAIRTNPEFHKIVGSRDFLSGLKYDTPAKRGRKPKQPSAPQTIISSTAAPVPLVPEQPVASITTEASCGKRSGLAQPAPKKKITIKRKAVPQEEQTETPNCPQAQQTQAQQNVVTEAPPKKKFNIKRRTDTEAPVIVGDDKGVKEHSY